MKIYVFFFTCLLSVALTLSAKPIKVGLYYESYCPGCQDFMRNQLIEAYAKFGGDITLDLLPFGNAEQEYKKGHWKFTCQHGPQECVGNKLHACAIYQACNGQETSDCAVTNVTSVLNYITCVEASNNQRTATRKCAKSAGLDGTAILQCAKSAEGSTLLNYYGNQTASHDYVPWVLINGKHNVDAETNLEQTICQLRPKLCK